VRNILLLLMLGMSFSLPSYCGELTADESAVWELEKAYYQYAEKNDPEGYLELFDENVIGWPALDKAPKGKGNVSQWISLVHQHPSEAWKYEIERLAIHSFEDVVVVHYLLRDFFVSAESGEEIRSASYRISHTWQRRGDFWQIISGMGAVQN